MKKLICLILLDLTISCVWAQTERQERQWKVKLTVVDDDSKPVPGAQVAIGYDVPQPPDERIPNGIITGLTDSNGVFSASHRDKAYSLGFRIEKSGYYRTWTTRGLGIDYNPVKWNLTLALVLKKIGQPIPMYAKAVNGSPTVSNQPIGYDMMTGDWIAPYGKGSTSDIIFEWEYNKKSELDYDSKIAISFPNPGDGIQEFSVPSEGSDLRSPHEAPVDGYQPQLLRDHSVHPGQPKKFDYDQNRNYFFRVRTVLDEKGNVKSALYGKIYGDFMVFRYYLNPKSNSRNVEFDPQANLIKEFRLYSERVKNP